MTCENPIQVIYTNLLNSFLLHYILSSCSQDIQKLCCSTWILIRRLVITFSVFRKKSLKLVNVYCFPINFSVSFSNLIISFCYPCFLCITFILCLLQLTITKYWICLIDAYKRCPVIWQIVFFIRIFQRGFNDFFRKTLNVITNRLINILNDLSQGEILDISSYFDEMELSDEEREQRKEFSKSMTDIMLFIFALFSVMRQYFFNAPTAM